MDNANKRPLSPHLGIYKPQISSVTSIMHRVTGFALYISLIILVWTLAMLFYCNYSSENLSQMLLESQNLRMTLKVFLVCLNFAVVYHFFNGIRHLAWDSGYGFKVKVSNITGILVLILSFAIAGFISYSYII